MRVPGLELSKIAFSKGEMDERVKQMKLMNEVMNLHIKEVNERLECHLRRIDFTNEFIARAHGYKGIIHQDSNN